ncbi:MAG: TonB-dependent receptor-like protein [Sphingomonas bacterium]|nr:TonB-dependent receptor-like protein [Sphingomonas bacterium]
MRQSVLRRHAATLFTSSLPAIGIALASLTVSTAAFAQEPASAGDPAPPTADAEAETNTVPSSTLSQANAADIVVTGSRIARSGFSAPTPVSVVGTERLQERGVTSIGDALNELPSFRQSNGPAQQGLTQNGYIGGRILDLRGLGAVRTLTLVDGKRFVPSTTQSTVDTNMIPSILLERAEVVTGGASAAYGSDAVAGVVNLILDRTFEGVKGTAQAGMSEQGDDEDFLLSLAAGAKMGDRVHVVLGGEWQKNRGVGNCQVRSWCRTDTLNFGRAGSGRTDIPANNILPEIHQSTIARTGVFNPTGFPAAGPVFGPLTGITFNPDGTPRRFVYGSSINSLYMIGGENDDQNAYFDAIPLKSPTQRYALYGKLTWEATDDITAGLDVSYGRLKANHGTVEYKNTGIAIRRDNAFISTIPRVADTRLNVADIIAANPGIPTFTFGRTFNDIGQGYITAINKTFRAVASLEGRLGDNWKWDAYYQYGNNNFRSDTRNATISANVLRAVDAVRDPSGNIVCRDTLSAVAATRAAAAGCVPFNPFGNRASAGALDYVTADAFQTNKTIEHVVAANVSGALFDLWAGPFSIAAGGEYRSDKISGGTDPVSRSLAFFAGNGSDIAGKIEVTEGYIEGELPLAKDIPFLQELSLNGAIRRTHYKREGAGTSSTVNATTWKVGAVWEPVDFLRFRATRSRDIRAPNINELFGPTTIGFQILTDPRNLTQTNARRFSGSNPALIPERANTKTIGVVLQPQGGVLGRMRASVDYYEVKIDDAIDVLGSQTIADRCNGGATEFCSLITRDTTGVITEVVDVFQNVNQVIARGYDIEFTYRQPLGGLGSADLRVLATINEDLITRDSVAGIQRAGQTGVRGGTVPGVPDYTIDALLTLNVEPARLSLHGRYIPKGIYNAAFIGPNQAGYTLAASCGTCSNTNSVESKTYIDVLGQVDVLKEEKRNVTFYLGVDNLFNTEPPLIPGANGVGNNLLFSPVGRSYKAGMRFRY